MNLTPEEKAVGRDNYYAAMGVSRRDFFKEVIAAGAVTGAGLGAMYFGYQKVGDPVRVGVIGTGDEGNILIGAISPDYVKVVAIADIRPSSVHRAFHGDWGGGNPELTHQLRPGLMQKYGWKTEDEARKHVRVYTRAEELLDDENLEAVIIALPLHLHAPVAVEAMQKGKHVLTEKLMAHNIAQCKVMSRLAANKSLHLATGHQRHYNVLYDNAVNLLQWGIFGQIHSIRAQWHRGNLPGRDSWAVPIPGGQEAEMDDPGGNKFKKGQTFDQIAYELKRKEAQLAKSTDPQQAALLAAQVAQWKVWDSDKEVQAHDFGYLSQTLANGRQRSALEELVRWRLWNRTGGGLMAELGSHQLDAASIFISALRKDGKKSHPLTVHAVGGRQIFPLDRDAEDHVYCMFEFPAPGYDAKFDVGYADPFSRTPDPETGIPSYDNDHNKKIVVTYSSINGNGFGGYGEVVMGTKGTLVLEREQDVLLYKGSSTSTKVGVKDDGGGPTLDTQQSGDPGAAVAQAAAAGPVSRGYTEEIEHWAWCIRNPAPENKPRCYPEVATGDAVIALTAKEALKNSATDKGGFIKFDEAWFDINRDETPDGSRVENEKTNLKV